MKIIFIGDLHGKHEIVDKVMDKDGFKIFLGDFMDSYDRSVKDHELTIQKVLTAVKSREAASVIGNHEMSYLFPDRHRCSGWDPIREVMFKPYHIEIFKYCEPFIKLPGNFVVSHAGFNKHSIKGLSLDDDDGEVDSWAFDMESEANWIGWARGGRNPKGGIYWMDWNSEFQPIPGINQIVGHTRGKGIRIQCTENQDSYNYCVDCLDYGEPKFLELEL